MSENNFSNSLAKRKTALEILMKQKVEQYNNVAAQKDQLSNEIIELNGKLSMVKELIQEQETTRNKDVEKKDEKAPEEKK